MLESSIPAKTEAGRLEIDGRKLKIGARQRMVLISINGERTVGSIRKQFVAIDDIDSLLQELLSSGLIEFDAAAHVPDHAEAITAPPPELPASVKVAASKPPAAAAKPAAASTAAPTATHGLAQAREYVSHMLSAKVGLRAFLFSQKIEKSTSPEALREHLPEVRRLLRKSLDAGKVAEFSDHVEALLSDD